MASGGLLLILISFTACDAGGEPDATPSASSGDGTPVESQELTVEEVRTVAESGHPVSQALLGLWHARGEKGLERDFDQAREWFSRAAAQGDAQGQAGMGFLHATGNGVGRDLEQAAVYYRLAARQGHARAARNLGSMALRGELGPTNRTEGLTWLLVSEWLGYESVRPEVAQLRDTLDAAEVGRAEAAARDFLRTNRLAAPDTESTRDTDRGAAEEGTP